MLHTNAMMVCKTSNIESDQHHLGRLDTMAQCEAESSSPCHMPYRQSLAMPAATLSFLLAFGLNVTVAVEGTLLISPFILLLVLFDAMTVRAILAIIL
jgi:hypothetical protein